jgi:predicted TIM-barrel fold metal-dependent hydrolase
MIAGARIIDFHGHQGAWEFYGMRDDARRMLRAMDLAGIDQACLFNIFHVEARLAHEQLASYVREAPDRFIGFAYASPLSARMVEEVRFAIDELGFRAIKIYPPTGNISLRDPHWQPLFEFADERELAVISHTGTEPSCQPAYFGDVAPQFPRANFVIGHSGNIRPHRDHAIEAALACPNVYLETCSSYREVGVIEELVDRAGAEKVLFGSDVPLMDPRCQLGRILTARISAEAKQRVLGGNARRLLRLT